MLPPREPHQDRGSYSEQQPRVAQADMKPLKLRDARCTNTAAVPVFIRWEHNLRM